MKYKKFNWNDEKNQLLKNSRGLSFEEVEKIIKDGGIIDIIDNLKDKYSNQRIFIIKVQGYLCQVPFVEDEEEIFLKTIFPDRKLKKYYKG